ncbi:uncharacterized protein LOC144381647 [Halichoerus grypus]
MDASEAPALPGGVHVITALHVPGGGDGGEEETVRTGPGEVHFGGQAHFYVETQSERGSEDGETVIHMSSQDAAFAQIGFLNQWWENHGSIEHHINRGCVPGVSELVASHELKLPMSSIYLG